MKKIVALCLAALVSGAWFSGAAFAQEDPQAQEAPAQDPGAASFREKETEGREQQAQTEQRPTGGQVTIGWGTLNINGMFLFGARARGANQEGRAKDGNWALDGINAVWEENRADLYLNYSLSNFGAFLGLRAAGYGANSLIYSGSIPYILARYAFVYANFGPAKLSVGKLYDELLPVQGSRVWKSEGPGDSHRFTDEENYSVRLEVKPIEGLNVGAQFFFPLIEDFRIDGRDPISGYYEKGLDETDAWKEIGLGASYTSGLFNAQLGVRFDSNADRFGSQDSGPQANGGYLPLYYGQFSLLSAGVKADVYDYVRGDGFKTPQLKHKDKIIGVTGKDYQGQDVIGYLPYDGGTYAFFGFNFKGVENLAVRAHGGLYNLGAFDEFGYGRFSEDIKYNNLIGGLSIGITMQQEFYGSDVWPDTMVNSPFLQFGPQVSYAIITMPQMPMPVLQATLDTSFGFCQDVLDLYAKVKPSMTLSLGVFMVDLFYELEYSGFTEKAVIKPMTRHTVGLAAMLVF